MVVTYGMDHGAEKRGERTAFAIPRRNGHLDNNNIISSHKTRVDAAGRQTRFAVVLQEVLMALVWMEKKNGRRMTGQIVDIYFLEIF